MRRLLKKFKRGSENEEKKRLLQRKTLDLFDN